MVTCMEHTKRKLLGLVVQKLLPEQTLRRIHRHRQTELNIDGWYIMQYQNGSAALLETNVQPMPLAILEINFIGNRDKDTLILSFVDLFKTPQSLPGFRFTTIHARVFGMARPTISVMRNIFIRSLFS